MEEEEEPKEGEEPKPDVTSLLILFGDLHCSPKSKYLTGFLVFQGEKKKKTKTEKYWDWELANETKPIWVS